MTASPPNDLPPDTVLIRWLSPDAIAPEAFGRLARWLEPAERARAARFHFERDRQAYVAAHALTRVSLSRSAPRGPDTWRFTTGRHGRPEIEDAMNPSGLRFNLSHTRGLVAVALTRGSDIGVDVELIDPDRLGPEVTDRFFAPAENAHLRSLGAEARTEAAYAFWTLKEAYIKAIGLGLSCPLSAFHFVLEPLAIHFSDRLDDDPARWLARRFRPTPDHALALAVRHDDPARLRVDARPVAVDELI